MKHTGRVCTFILKTHGGKRLSPESSRKGFAKPFSVLPFTLAIGTVSPNWVDACSTINTKALLFESTENNKCKRDLLYNHKKTQSPGVLGL